MRYLKTHNWDKNQSYRKDRGTPPWIKVHRNLLSNQKWARLTDQEKGQVVSLWIVAADQDGILPDDPIVLKKMCQLDDAPNIKKFKEIGLFDDYDRQYFDNKKPERQPPDVNLTPTCQPSVAPETETETEILFTDVNNISKKSQKLKKPDDVSETVWEDFIKHRKAKKAPVTETVLKSIKLEADKIGWPLEKALAEACARGWQGFKADWVFGAAARTQPKKQSYSDTLENVARQAIENLERRTSHEIY